MRYLLLLLLVPVFGLGQTTAGKFKLKGSLSLSKPVNWVYLRYRPAEEVIVDSVQPQNGSFKFEGKIREPLLAMLSVAYNTTADAKRATETIPVFLEPGTIELTAKDSLKNNTVAGSKAHQEFLKLGLQEKPFEDKQQALTDAYIKARDEGDRATMNRLEKEGEALDNDMREQVYKPYVTNNPQSPIALYALKQYAGYEINADKVDPLFASLPAGVRKWPSAVFFSQELDIARKTGIGRQAIDFTQNDTAGHPLSLSSLRGKYVLVDFWASWCRPCRMENPNVVKAYNKYKDKNFTILSVSLDRPDARERWIKAIHDDRLTWNHVSDLKYWDNAVAKLYGIRAIPQNLLLDPSGKIVARNLRGEDLDSRLSTLLAQQQ